MLPARGLREQHTGRAASHKAHRGTSLRRCTPGLAGLYEVLARNETAQVPRRCWYFDLTPVRPHRICVRLVRCPLTQTFWQGGGERRSHRGQASNMLCANGCRVLLPAVCTTPGSASVTPPPLQPDCARSKSKCWKPCPTGKSRQHRFRYPKNSGWRPTAPTSRTHTTTRIAFWTRNGTWSFRNRPLAGSGISLKTAQSQKVGTELG